MDRTIHSESMQPTLSLGSTADAAGRSACRPAVPSPASWIATPGIDVLFFSGSIFLGIFYGLFASGQPSWAGPGNTIIFVALGLTHFGSTWAFYFDRVNLAQFKTRPWIYFYIPVLLIAVSIGLTALGFFAALTAITYWFSGFHVMKQNAGFASLYRGRIGLRDPADRKIDNAAIMSASLFLLFARYLRFTDFGFEAFFQTTLGQVLLGVAGIWVAGVLLVWARAAVRRWQRLGADSLPLLLFTLASIVMFVPFILVEDFNTAFMANLLGHYVQYLGLVWMINRRKYGKDSPDQFGSRFLQTVSQNMPILIVLLLTYALFVYVGQSVTPLFPAVGLTWVHFFVDRYLFRFRDAHVRDALLPYLKPANTESAP